MYIAVCHFQKSLIVNLTESKGIRFVNPPKGKGAFCGGRKIGFPNRLASLIDTWKVGHIGIGYHERVSNTAM